MTCKKVMTANPAVCLVGDTVVKAAELMKSKDVGSIPVLADEHSRKIVGIVTDRDLTIHVLGSRRDPRSTRVDEIMTPNPITCYAGDDMMDAMRSMSKHQVRRIPVVNKEGRLLGIVAQADIARQAHEGDVGAVVENISEPEGSASGFKGHSSGSAKPLVGALALAAGAGLMYLFDPDRGRRRRSVVRDKMARASRETGQVLEAAAKDFRNRRDGILAKAKSLVHSEPAVPDAKLEARVRSLLGRATSHPHAIHVDAKDGCITLSGPILAAEADRLHSLVCKVPGVQDVRNNLEVHESGSVQVASGRSHAKWSPAGRVFAGAFGGGLALYGVSRSSRIAKTAATSMGVGLLARSFTNRAF